MESTAVEVDDAAGRAAAEKATPRAEIGHLLRLAVPVIVKLAERKMRVAEIIRLGPGSIIEFDKPAEEPLDLMVSNLAVGQGDVVKVGENFGMRITRIGGLQQTIRALGGLNETPKDAGDQTKRQI